MDLKKKYSSKFDVAVFCLHSKLTDVKYENSILCWNKSLSIKTFHSLSYYVKNKHAKNLKLE